MWREAGGHWRYRMNMLQTQGTGQSDGGQEQGKGLQMEGKEVYRHIVPVKGENEEVNRQCHSRNRTKYIYINSLLYNHDKQQQKKNIHTKI